MQAGVLKNLDEIKSSHAYHTAQVNKPEHVRASPQLAWVHFYANSNC